MENKIPHTTSHILHSTLVPQKTSNQTEKFIIFLIITIGIVSGYFYYSSAAGEVSAVPIPTIDRDLRKFEKISFDFSIFDKVSFKELKIFGEQPLKPGTEGKINLFAPF